MSLQAGTLVGRYRVARLIAQGGMAEVYRAEQELAGGIYRPAALKVIRPEYSEAPEFREMFLDEARLACTLAHPNIVHIYEVGEADGRLYMAMELVSGESLASVARQLREKDERLSNEALIAIGIYTCSALEAVHALRMPGQGHVNLVHRDVSPHNLLLSANGSLKLIDFGIAKATSNRNLTSAGVTKGKAGYFSPEQAMGKSLDGRSDLFSLGVTLYKLAWGATPFDQYKGHHERNTALVHGEWHPLRKVCPGLPEGFYDVVDRALQVNPEDRFADAAQMRLMLERLALESAFTVGPSTLAGYVSTQEEEPSSLAEARVERSGRHAQNPRVSNPPHSVPAATRVSPTRATEALSVPSGIGRGGGRAKGGVASSRSAQTSRVAAAAPLSAPPSAAAGRHQTERMLARAVTLPSVEIIRARGWQLASAAAAVVLLIGGAVVWLGDSPDDAVAEPGTAQAAPSPIAAHAAAAPAGNPDGSALAASAEAQAARTEDPERGEVPARASALEPAAVQPAGAAERPERRTVRRQVRREPTRIERGAEDKVKPRSTSGLPGRLRFGPGDGVVTINGRVRGNSPMDVVLPPGIYSVVVKSPDGSNRLARTVEVRGDDINAIVVNFDRP